ncbi:MAG: CMD domain protein [Enhydrobacter sp.]|nr:MAG: CMD domain protein [Enhydrobacter sp.]
MSDVIDALVGIAPGSRLDAVRAQRAEARKHAQASYDALFAPAAPGGFTPDERFAVAAFVAGLHREPRTGAHYESKLPAGLRGAVAAQVAAARGEGPYGRFPRGPLSAEDAAGPIHRIDDAARAALGPKLAAAFEHVHMLVFHPRDASAAALQKLLDAGWTTTEIVTLSQLVSFLAFQIRVVAGLRVLNAELA